MNEKRVIVDAFTALAPRYEKVVDKELKRFWGWGYDDFVDNMIQMTPISEGATILDVATGTAVIPLKLIRRGQMGGQIVGLDITLAMLLKAKRKIEAQKDLPANQATENQARSFIRLSCASAMAMPYRNNHFDVILCALATHHLDVPVVLAEMARVLKPGGSITIADAMGSVAWRQPIISALIRTGTFLYFLPQEGFSRAKAESSALSNVYNGEEWEQNLSRAGFGEIKITHLSTNHSWLPAPLVIQGRRNNLEGKSVDSR